MSPEEQSTLLSMLKKYEEAYYNTLKVLSTKKDKVLIINHPLMDSLKYYKQRMKEIREKIKNER